ncbi:glycoside hydrolase family 25 protein [Corynebacterium qintianiae]|uniref:glycoside hydrolase family 25 protein n=1 Tax=Corynebacterium qintianiae TaxID=2709392 RepID=UPI001F403479|nr:glycoside hydrolase family 25 protein [Corynebacterium qintianiae]
MAPRHRRRRFAAPPSREFLAALGPGQALMRFGVDVSEHQDGLALSSLDISFVVLRTTDGTYRDRVFSSHLADALSAGLEVETYHYLRNSSEGTSISEQVEASLAVLGSLRAPLWLDCETPAGLSLDDVSLAHSLFTSAGVPVAGIYTSRRWWRWRMLGADTRRFGALWLAEYGADTGSYPGDAAWPSAVGKQWPTMWQYTSRGRVPGYDGDVDFNARR